LLSFVLVLSAVVAEASAARGLSHVLMLVAILVAGAALLDAVGRVVDEERSRIYALLAGVGLAVIVTAAAVREPVFGLLWVVPTVLGALAAPRRRSIVRPER
jgi:hypothetical protein